MRSTAVVTALVTIPALTLGCTSLPEPAPPGQTPLPASTIAGATIETRPTPVSQVINVAGQPWFVQGDQIALPDGGTAQLPAEVRGAASMRDGVWVSLAGGELVKLGLDGALVVRAGSAVGAEPAGLAVGGDSLWVTEPGRHRVVRRDPGEGVFQSAYPAGGRPETVAVTDERVWVTGTSTGSVTRLDLDEAGVVVGSQTVLGVCPGPRGIAEQLGVLAVACSGDDRVSIRDPETLGGRTSIVMRGVDDVLASNGHFIAVSRVGPTLLVLDTAGTEVRRANLKLGDSSSPVSAVVLQDDLVISWPATSGVIRVPLSKLTP